VFIGTVLNVVVFFILTEALPKTWAVLNPERAALLTARPVSWLVRFWPLRVVSRLFIGITNVIIKGKGLRTGPFVSEGELLGIVQTAADEEVIEHEERELIESIIEFGDTVVREVMVPRADMVTVDATDTVADSVGLAIEQGFSRMPVVGKDIDDIVGVVYTKDLVRAERAGRGDEPVANIMRKPHFVPETKKVDRMLREMQAGKNHLAIVVDEYGGTAGIVTLEDLLEELVGDIRDEFDIDESDIVSLGDGALRVHGRMPISELNDLLDAELPDDDWDTVGGLIFSTLGHVPTVGEQVDVPPYRLVVERLQGRRITRVRISAAPSSDPADREAEAAEA
jgi:CBS domain containing-hemolysin-like protein